MLPLWVVSGAAASVGLAAGGGCRSGPGDGEVGDDRHRHLQQAGEQLDGVMVRPTYDLNGTVQDVPIFVDSATPGAFEHLGGFRRLPAGWTVDWPSS
jgi:hypothetical protein